MSQIQTRFCECCRKQINLQCAHDEVREKAAEAGWEASIWDRDICKETCRLSSYANGDHNNTILIQATRDGIDIMDGICTLDWEWIDAMRAKVKSDVR